MWVMWGDVVWCGVVWCGVMWCGVVWLVWYCMVWWESQWSTYNFVVALENTEDAIIDGFSLFKVFFKGKCLQQAWQDLI